MSLELEIRRHRPEAPWTYSAKDARQREVAERVRSGGPGAILLSEVAPVITLGRRTPESDLPLPPASYSALGIEVLATDRGGLATYHGPGQWVLFVVDRLERLTSDPKGVRRAVSGLLEVGLTVGRKYRPDAEIREGCELGVWSRHGKFAAVGVHVQDGVLLHGLSFNGFRTPTSFVGLRPCGLDAPVDFVLREDSFEKAGAELAEAALCRFSSFSPKASLRRR